MRNDRILRLYCHNNSIKILIILFCLCFSGCTKYYYNPAFPDNLQQQMLNRDMAFCNALASGAIPQQQLVVNSVPSSTTYGNFNAYDNSNQYSGTYSSYTTYDNSAAQVADMANSMSVIAASINRENIYNQCLAGKGWVKIKDKELSEDEKGQFNLLPSKEQAEEAKKEHFKKIKQIHPDLDQIVYNPLFVAWKNKQSDEVQRISKSGNAYEVIAVITKFKQSPIAQRAKLKCPDWKEFPKNAYFEEWLKQATYDDMYKWAITNSNQETLLDIYMAFQDILNKSTQLK
ncbi:hypothetical protein [Maridesulfovibrio sp.]|uniref:hypothetical protein n=1 Tax=Maridesulfovibrio sp. TaxID=2795000 RepID=UPI002AA79514|nr:hypothetical protein [Maridesulfovibrio sp.]